jgi:hypothetical protein
MPVGIPCKSVADVGVGKQCENDKNVAILGSYESFSQCTEDKVEQAEHDSPSPL